MNSPHTHAGTDASECITCEGTDASECIICDPVVDHQRDPFSDAELLSNGFEQTQTTFRKHVFRSGPDPMTAGSNTPLEPMNAPPFIPRTGYLRTQPQPPPLSPRAEVLREAEKLITGERNETYGEPTHNFSNVAELLTVQFRHKLKDGERFTAADVAQIQIHTKMARMIAQPQKDNYVDIAGYAACGWECQDTES